ncbi:hypothetical protein E8E14_000803 [Neopestalotiopsis sp. 37M]|nr:hypothetical protein E8E14_000803 [Neopestalotiopsis sp. 37M]
MDCNVIRTIPCDIQQLNVTAFPQNDIFTTRLSDTLPTCGDACCPFGYRCNGDNDCELEVEDVATTTSAAPSKSTDKASHHQATTTTTSSILAQTTPVDAQVSATADEGMSSTTRTGLIIGGTVAAALLMTILAGVLFFYTRRRNRRRQESINDLAFHEDSPKESPGPQERRQQDPSLTKFRTWRGQSYYARADDKSSQVSPRTKIPEPIIECAELPATPPPRFKSFEFGPDVLTATSEMKDLEANKKTNKSNSNSKLRAITFRFIPIGGAILVVFSLGGGFGYAFNGKPLPQDAVVGISATFLVLGALFALGCLKLHCHRSRYAPSVSSTKPAAEQVVRSASGRTLRDRMTQVFASSKLDLEYEEKRNIESFLERGRNEKRKPQRGSVRLAVTATADEKGSERRQDGPRNPGKFIEQISPNMPRAPPPVARPAVVPQDAAIPAPRSRFSWEPIDRPVDRAHEINHNVHETYISQQQQQQQQQPARSGTQSSTGGTQKVSPARDDSAQSLPKRSHATRRRDTPHPRTNATTSPQGHTPRQAGPERSEDPDRLAYEIAKMSGMARRQADIRGSGEPILMRSSSKKKTGPIRGNKLSGSVNSGPTGATKSHKNFDDILGVDPLTSRPGPAYAQPAFMPDQSANDNGDEQGAEFVQNLQQSKHDYGRSLTARDQEQIHRAVMESAPEWI